MRRIQTIFKDIIETTAKRLTKIHSCNNILLHTDGKTSCRLSIINYPINEFSESKDMNTVFVFCSAFAELFYSPKE